MSLCKKVLIRKILNSLKSITQCLWKRCLLIVSMQVTKKKKTHNNNNFLINNSLGEERSMEEKSMGWECESDFEIVCAKETDCKGGLADTCLVILIAFKCVLLLILGH